jgi:hypothetical protein
MDKLGIGMPYKIMCKYVSIYNNEKMETKK